DSQVSFEAMGRWGGRTIRHLTGIRFQPTGRSAQVVHNQATPIDPPTSLGPGNAPINWLGQTVGTMQFYRWIPSMLALPVAFDFATQFGLESPGFVLAMYLNDILISDHQRFGELERRFHDVFPAVRRIRLYREGAYQTAP